MFEYVLLSPVADRILGRRYSADPDNWQAVLNELGYDAAVRQMAIDRLDLAQTLGHDMMYAWPNPPAPSSLAPEPAEPPVDDDPVETLRRRNQRRAAQPQADLDQTMQVYVHLKQEMSARGLDLPILAPAYTHGVWTDVDLMQTMLLEPAVAHEHFDLATRDALALIDAYLKLGIDQIGVGGDFAGNSPLISAQAYRDFIVPQVRACSRHIHKASGYAINASDGNLWSVLEDFTTGCEIDGYLEIDLHAGMELRPLKEATGGRVTLYGNLDCGNTLSFGTPNIIRQHVIDCLDAGEGTSHILCASNAITASVPFENYMTVVETYRQYFGLPRLDIP